jgi:RNA 2',3'-cyclic 3'-phosphodiesterase
MKITKVIGGWICMERKTHFFFALRLSDEVKEELRKICLSLKEDFPFNRWVHHQDYHITLAFLGSAPDDKLKHACELVREQLKGQKTFSLHINQLGVFGKQEAPRIFWADTIREGNLNTVRDIVFSSCIQAGFELETRPFKPHITLARKWMGDRHFSDYQLKEMNPFSNSPLSFEANEIVLYQTHLDRTPKYEGIANFPLQA